MKYTVVLLLVLCLSLATKAQSISDVPAPAVAIANKIADKLKDSLNLSQPQRAKVFAINIQLFNEKRDARASSQDPAVVGRRIQLVENRRDSLYAQVLSEKQKLNYKEKKKNLVNNN